MNTIINKDWTISTGNRLSHIIEWKMKSEVDEVRLTLCISEDCASNESYAAAFQYVELS